MTHVTARKLVSACVFVAVVATAGGCSVVSGVFGRGGEAQGGGAVAYATKTETTVAPAPRVSELPRNVLTQAALRQHTFLTDGGDADVSLDPTGQWMVFTSTRHTDKPKVYLQKVDGVTVTQLTTDDSSDAHPVFSPDGKRIAFSSDRSGKWSLYTIDVSGGGVTQVTNSRTQDLHPSFSPDGGQIVYSSMGARSGQWELWVVEVATGSKRMIGEGLFPVWSPEKGSNKIAFQRPRQRGARQYSLWTLELVGGEPRRLTEVVSASDAAAVAPAWSPDGKSLAYATMSDDGAGAVRYDVWVVGADGTNRRRLTDGVGIALSPTFGADGRVYYVSDRAGNESVWSVAPGGGAEAVAGKAAEPKAADHPVAGHSAPEHKAEATKPETPAGQAPTATVETKE